MSHAGPATDFPTLWEDVHDASTAETLLRGSREEVQVLGDGLRCAADDAGAAAAAGLGERALRREFQLHFGEPLPRRQRLYQCARGRRGRPGPRGGGSDHLLWRDSIAADPQERERSHRRGAGAIDGRTVGADARVGLPEEVFTWHSN